MTLQQQAEKLISDLGLVEKLGGFGETHLVGNVAFGTTVKPDLDIQIYASGHYEDVSSDIVVVLEKIGLEDIAVRRLKRSKKLLITGTLNQDGIPWALDVTLTQPDKRYIRDSYQFYLDYFPKMTNEKRAKIVEFKQEFADKKITGDNAAFYIYIAVLDKNIETTARMSEYLGSL